MSIAVSPSATLSVARDLSHELSCQALLEHSAILSIGRDPRLLASRAAVLRVSGRTVHSAAPEQLHLLENGVHISLVVLGHSLADSEVTELARYFRRAAPGAKLMLTCFDPRPSAVCSLVDGCVSSVDGPAVLMHTVRRLLAESVSDEQH